MDKHTQPDHWGLSGHPHIHLNHGGYGQIPQEVRDFQISVQRQVDKNPTDYFRSTFRQVVQASKEALAPCVHLDPDSFTFVRNATEGFSILLKSEIFFPKNARVLIFDTTYASMARGLRLWGAHIGLQFHTLPTPETPSEEEQCLDAFKQALDSFKPHTVLIDHISSASAWKHPVEKMIPLCKAKGIRTIVDGAHTPGHIALDLGALAPDAYFANLHKWFYAPRGLGFLAVPDRALAQTLWPTSLTYIECDGFPGNFDFQGTVDISPIASLPLSLRLHAQWSKEREAAQGRLFQGLEAAAEALLEWQPVLPPQRGLMMGALFLNSPNLGGLAGNETYVQIWNACGVQVAIMPRPRGGCALRLCSQIYVSEKDMREGARKAAQCLDDLLKKKRHLGALAP